MATMTALAVPMTGANRDALALSRAQLVREPLGGRTWRGTLTHRGGLELQSRLPAGATALRIQSLRWTTGGEQVERGPYAPWRPGEPG